MARFQKVEVGDKGYCSICHSIISTLELSLFGRLRTALSCSRYPAHLLTIGIGAMLKRIGKGESYSFYQQMQVFHGIMLQANEPLAMVLQYIEGDQGGDPLAVGRDFP